jgi:DNA-directed RNA polymerase subunit RPC12/RpoP
MQWDVLHLPPVEILLGWRTIARYECAHCGETVRVRRQRDAEPLPTITCPACDGGASLVSQ